MGVEMLFYMFNHFFNDVTMLLPQVRTEKYVCVFVCMAGSVFVCVECCVCGECMGEEVCVEGCVRSGSRRRSGGAFLCVCV